MEVNRNVLIGLWALAVAIATGAGVCWEHNILWGVFPCLAFATIIVIASIYLKLSQTWNKTIEEGKKFSFHLAKIIVFLIRYRDIGTKKVEEVEKAQEEVKRDFDRAFQLFGEEEKGTSDRA